MNVHDFFKKNVVSGNIATFGDWELRFREKPEMTENIPPLCFFYSEALRNQGRLDEEKRQEINGFLAEVNLSLQINTEEELCWQLASIGFIPDPDPKAEIAQLRLYRDFHNVRVTFGRELPLQRTPKVKGRFETFSKESSWHQ